MTDYREKARAVLCGNISLVNDVAAAMKEVAEEAVKDDENTFMLAMEKVHKLESELAALKAPVGTEEVREAFRAMGNYSKKITRTIESSYRAKTAAIEKEHEIALTLHRQNMELAARNVELAAALKEAEHMVITLDLRIKNLERDAVRAVNRYLEAEAKTAELQKREGLILVTCESCEKKKS